MFDVNKKKKEDARREEICAMFREFLEGKGKLPVGFSEPYSKTTASGRVRRGTPFDVYLDEIWHQVDALRDRSGISDWLFFDGSADMDAAVETIAGWVRLHREMNALLREKCRVGNTTIFAPVDKYCTGRVMVVMGSDAPIPELTAASIRACEAENISLCTIVSERRLYDLAQQKEMEIQSVTYPNYHDETYADWWLEAGCCTAPRNTPGAVGWTLLPDPEALERIRRMERIFDDLRADPAREDLRRELTAYYEGGQWLRDYELDERGLLPPDLKRGVLSQDGVYDLLSNTEE